MEFRALAVVNRVDGGVIGFDLRGGKSGAFPVPRAAESRPFPNRALSCDATASVVNSSVPAKLYLLSIVERRKCEFESYGF